MQKRKACCEDTANGQSPASPGEWASGESKSENTQAIVKD